MGIRWGDGRERIAYGADYNPEQWSPDVWREDVRLMRNAGVNLVSLGIFAWSTLEPEDGRYDFALFDEVMDLLAAHGIHADLATATASPPAWLVQQNPDILPTDDRGVVLGFGSRQSYCPSSEVFRAKVAALTTAMATEFGNLPAPVRDSVTALAAVGGSVLLVGGGMMKAAVSIAETVTSFRALSASMVGLNPALLLIGGALAIAGGAYASHAAEQARYR